MRTYGFARFAWAPAAIAALALSACGDEGGGGAQAGLKEQDRVMGDPDAPVTVIEYASITCSHCKRWHDEVYPRVKEELVDTGMVRFVFRELPTAPMDVSVAGFLVARCAPESRYFSVIDTLFDRQERLFTAQDRRAELLAVARAAGLSEDEFNACIRDEDQIARINEWSDEAATRYRITGTPGFVINGVVHNGEQPFETFAEAVEDATGEPVPTDSEEESGEAAGMEG